MKDKKFLLSIIGVVFAGGLLYFASTVSAQTPTQTTFTADIVKKIAQRFNLNQADVQKVFDEARDEKHKMMQSVMEERLNQAVKENKINDSQKSAILKKFSQLKNERLYFGQLKYKTNVERRQEMEKRKTDLENWAKENGLTLQVLKDITGHPGFGFGMKGHMRGMWK